MIVLFLTLATLVAASTTAEAQPTRERTIYANSLCDRPISFLIYHKDAGNADYHTHGWFTFAPYAENRLSANGVTLKQLVGSELYFYGETTDPNGGSVTWRGNSYATFEGVNYAFQPLSLTVNSRGELEFKLTCGR
jgi:hypothetical protein